VKSTFPDPHVKIASMFQEAGCTVGGFGSPYSVSFHIIAISKLITYQGNLARPWFALLQPVVQQTGKAYNPRCRLHRQHFDFWLC